MKKIVIAFSGGMDSATLLSMMLNKGYEVHACIFSYGSKHNKYENKAAKEIIQEHQANNKAVKAYYFDLEKVFAPFNSNLLLTGGAIPEGHYENSNMSKTVVPGRNTIFASILMGLAESIGAEKITLGVHAGDHAIYPDCRAEYIKALDTLVYLATDKKIQVDAPLIDLTKEGILKIGITLSTSYDLTRTCYKDQELSCGKCGSCQERLEAFELIGIKDPISYE